MGYIVDIIYITNDWHYNPIMNRDPYFDNLKFLLILLVVINHIIGSHHAQNGFVLVPLHVWLTSFHMPLFIFVAGYFANPDKSRGVILSRYLIPYIIINPLYYLVTGLGAAYYLYPSFTLWFLLAILFYHLLLPFVVKHLKATIAVSIALALVSWNFDGTLNNLLGMPRVLAFMPYFFIGYLARVKQVGFAVGFRAKFLAYCILVLMFLACYISRDIFNIVWLKTDLIAVRYMFLALVMSLAFLCAVPNTKTFYTTLGRNTLYVYLLHGFIAYNLQISNPMLLLAASVLVAFALSSNLVKSIMWPFIEPRLFTDKLRFSQVAK